jgi:HAD superfamily hydrolase (TIGR01549 family)
MDILSIKAEYIKQRNKMKEKMQNFIAAIFWDYDGTLVDTRKKNFNVASQIIYQTTKKQPRDFPALEDPFIYDSYIRQYPNWREFYRESFNMNEEQIDEAGSLWTEYQLNDSTETPLIDGIKNIISSLKEYPQGIISQNSKQKIAKVLGENGLSLFFNFIVGYEEVDIRRQKPEPDGLLQGIHYIPNIISGYIFYVGDHPTDIHSAINANKVLSREKSKLQFKTIGASYGTSSNPSDWDFKPDFCALDPSQIIEIVQNFTL